MSETERHRSAARTSAILLVAALGAFVVPIVVAAAFPGAHVPGLGAPGVLFVVAGVHAIRTRSSAVRGVGPALLFPERTQDHASMTAAERQRHAARTGAALVLFGAFLTLFDVLALAP